MKSIGNVLAGTMLAAGALLGVGTAFSIAGAADETDTAAAPAQHPGGWHHHHGEWSLYSKLGLTAEQKASIKTIMQTNGPQMKSLHEQMRTNSQKLEQTQPNDPNYANVVSQTAAANAPVHQQMETLKGTIRQQMFTVLTAAQQSQLQALQAQREARRAAYASGSPPPGT